MAVSIEKKKSDVQELSEKFSTNSWCLLANPIGMTVAEVSELRKRLRENNVDFKIYKNTLIKKAIEESGKEGFKQVFDDLKGPTGVAFTSDDCIVATKVFTDFLKENQKLQVKSATLENDYWTKEKCEEMAKLGNAKAIYGILVSALLGPVANLSFTLNAMMFDLVGTLEEVSKQK